MRSDTQNLVYGEVYNNDVTLMSSDKEGMVL